MIKTRSLWLLVAFIIFSPDSYAQTNWKRGFFKSAKDFLNQTPVDTGKFSFKPIPEFKSKLGSRAIIPNHYRLITNRSQLPIIYHNSFSCLAFDGESLFINLKMLRMASGFIRIENPSTHNFFMGIPQLHVDQGSVITSGTYGWVSQDGPIDQRESKPYVYSLTTGRIHVLTPSTLERLLEPYSEILQLYRKDPNWKTLGSMKVYLEILNELLNSKQ